MFACFTSDEFGAGGIAVIGIIFLAVLVIPILVVWARIEAEYGPKKAATVRRKTPEEERRQQEEFDRLDAKIKAGIKERKEEAKRRGPDEIDKYHRAEARDALVALGYGLEEVEEELREVPPQDTFEKYIREALIRLGYGT